MGIEQKEVNGQVCHVRTLAQPAEFVKLKSKRPSAKQATDWRFEVTCLLLETFPRSKLATDLSVFGKK